MQRCIFVLAAGLTLSQPIALLAKDLPAEAAARNDAVRLLPASDWHLDVAQDSCRLLRKFGPENAPGFVTLQQNAPGPQFDLTVASPELADLSTQTFTYVGMRSDENLSTINPFAAQTAGFGTSLNLIGVSIAALPNRKAASNTGQIRPQIAIDDAAMVERIVVRNARTIVSFETGSLKAPLEAMNACSHELISIWGLDPKLHHIFIPARMPEARLYFGRLKNTFAKSSGSKGHSALLRVRALVAADGTVTDCHHEYALSSGGEEPNVCADIVQMQFAAATDRDGKAIASFYTKSTVLWPYSPWSVGADGGRWGGD